MHIVFISGNKNAARIMLESGVTSVRDLGANVDRTDISSMRHVVHVVKDGVVYK